MAITFGITIKKSESQEEKDAKAAAQFEEKLEQVRQALPGLIEELRDMKIELLPAIKEMSAKEAEIKRLAMILGESFSHDGVTLQYKKGGMRTTWATEKLEGLAEVYPKILNLRTVKQGNDTVAIVGMPK